jgi:dTDP-glucose 4,6-dehydratase
MAPSMKVLVTGGQGVIGRPLTELLEDQGHEVWVSDRNHSPSPRYLRCDVGEHRQLTAVMDAVKPELVYHLAAEFGRRNGEDFYETLWRSNVVGTKNVLRLQERLGFRMVFASSSEIYGEYGGLMSESVPDTKPLRPMNDYAISKWVNELQILNSEMRATTKTVRVRIFNTYGPGEHYSPYRSVACIFVYHALHGLPYEVYLRHRRSSTYIDDCIAALAAIAKHFHPGEVYNICGDETHSIKRLSDLVLKETGAGKDLVRYKEVEAFNTLVKRGDNRKAKRDLRWAPQVKLEEGVRRTVEWQRDVYGGTG